MSVCADLHKLAWRGTRFSFPFAVNQIPNGIYVLFEKGEVAHEAERIVRIGTHTGDRQLPSRMREHFVNKNKDRSVFRKNIGRALLNRANDPFLKQWEIDMTSHEARQRWASTIDSSRLKAIEGDVTKYIQGTFSFVLFRIDDKASRMTLESKMISTLSWCDECQPSQAWLGLSSPKLQIRESGLWNANELYKEPLHQTDIDRLAACLV